MVLSALYSTEGEELIKQNNTCFRTRIVNKQGDAWVGATYFVRRRALLLDSGTGGGFLMLSLSPSSLSFVRLSPTHQTISYCFD